MEESEYESLPESSGPLVHMAAGAAAGMFEHTAMFPFDVVKTRLQRLQPTPNARYHGLFHGLRTMVKTEGFSSLFSGIRVVAGGAGPAHALYFATYEKCKTLFGVDGHSGEHFPMATAAAAVFATFAHDMFMNPIEVVKQRLQVFKSPYRGVVHCAVSIYRQEGVRAFYRSFSAQLLMNVPYQCIHLVTYESLGTFFNPTGTYSPATHLIAGAGAGALAAAVTTPFDVAKTLLNTQEVLPAGHGATERHVHVVGLTTALRTIYTAGGVLGYAKGLSARVMFTAPAAAISWSVYEFFKFTLGVEGNSESNA